MNALLKTLIIGLAAVFGFALVAAGVSTAVTPDDPTRVKHDTAAAKRGDDAGAPVTVADDDNDTAGDVGQTRTRTRTGHRDGGDDRDDNSGPGSGGGDHTRDFSRDLTGTH